MTLHRLVYAEAGSSERLAIYHTTQCYILQDSILQMLLSLPRNFLPLHKSEVSVQELVTSNPKLDMPCLLMHVPSPFLTLHVLSILRPLM